MNGPCLCGDPYCSFCGDPEVRRAIDRLFENGWNSVDDPPNTSRLVQVAWDDGSYGESSLAFYDYGSGCSDDVKHWWAFPGMVILPTDNIVAWREKK